jgi:hypothetical protein
MLLSSQNRREIFVSSLERCLRSGDRACVISTGCSGLSVSGGLRVAGEGELPWLFGDVRENGGMAPHWEIEVAETWFAYRKRISLHFSGNDYMKRS